MVLDEVGLAEDSPSLPLKTLHPLLEDGTTKSQDVSFIIKAISTSLVGVVLIGSLFLNFKNKLPFYKKQVINENARVIVWLAQ